MGGPRRDLVGQRFGKLIVLEKLSVRNKQGDVLWACQCDCGNTCIVGTSDVIHRGKSSCGCDKRVMRKDVAGERFGNLVAIECVKDKGDHNSLWLCQCDCGKQHIVRLANLIYGVTKSCGCRKCQGNKIYLVGDVGICLLGAGGYFWFDAADVELAEKYNWHEHEGYARVRRNGKYIWFHRAVMGLTPDSPTFIDHINGDRHDSRKCNLRLCEHQQNMCHKLVKQGYRKTPTGSYAVSIGVRGKSIYIGTYATPEEARAAYEAARKVYHGEFCSYDTITIYCP